MESASPGPLSQGKVLIVNDNAPARRSLHSTLFSLGFDVGEAVTGEEAIALCHIVKYDAVLLNVDASGKYSPGTFRELRHQRPRVAILVLGVHDDHERRVEALEAGVDDYLSAAVNPRELAARIRAILRCLRVPSSQPEDIISIGDVQLHPERRLVTKAGEPVHLTPKEFDLLHYLMSHAGLPVMHSRLLHVIWGSDYANQLEYLRTFVRQIRRKLEDDATNPKYLVTDSHVGYRFVDSTQLSQ
jgi:two-component system KDP operon response regulator KdpE